MKFRTTACSARGITVDDLVVLVFILGLRSAAGDGGAVLAIESAAVAFAGLLDINHASGDGGGAYAADSATFVLNSGAELRSNSAAGNGGGLFAGGASATLGYPPSMIII